jgi:hypothetical protein
MGKFYNDRTIEQMDRRKGKKMVSAKFVKDSKNTEDKNSRFNDRKQKRNLKYNDFDF